ncbi:MAG: pilus assembly protein [Armatimonadetes bacterium]|nr:pilus assembly protein [Armatimonadota bacterium]
MQHPKLKRLHPSRRARRGQALVEFALVVILLIALVMGIIEFSVFGKNSLAIANATREGARTAAIGRTTTQIRERVARFASPLSVVSPDGSVVLEVSNDKGVTYSTLGDNANGTENAAAPDALVRVRVSSLNRSVTGAFGALFNRQMQTTVIMRRESTSGT